MLLTVIVCFASNSDNIHEPQKILVSQNECVWINAEFCSAHFCVFFKLLLHMLSYKVSIHDNSWTPKDPCVTKWTCLDKCWFFFNTHLCLLQASARHVGLQGFNLSPVTWNGVSKNMVLKQGLQGASKGQSFMMVTYLSWEIFTDLKAVGHFNGDD